MADQVPATTLHDPLTIEILQVVHVVLAGDRVYRSAEEYRSGRETLLIQLSRPLLELCGKSSFKRVRGFGALRMVARDHFVHDMVRDGLEAARKSCCAAERSFRFMEHTGLQPRSRKRRSYKDQIGKLPYSDHGTEWVDPNTNQLILVDEPYSIATR